MSEVADQSEQPADAAAPADGAPAVAVPVSDAVAAAEVPSLAEVTAQAVTDDLGGEPLIEAIDAADLADAAPAAPTEVAPDTADLSPGELRAVVEAVLFVATRPLGTERLCECLPGTSPEYLEGFLKGLAERWDHEGRGWELRHIAGGWQVLTRRSLHPWVRQLERRELPSKLSKGALETLAIVAYKQPITRGAIEDIRGVQCGPVLRQLMDLKLVLVTGRDDHALGRPLLYGTTEQFLTRFGLGAVGDLPRRHEFGA
jgi:segregation and condensation protein B